MRARKSLGAHAVVDAMTRSGVKRAFTVSGNHIMSLFDASLDAGVELIHTRHEAAAVHMADSWARLTGEPGIAWVTGGPGHANAVSALFTAKLAESPVVLLSGHAPQDQVGRGAFQEMRQAEMAQGVTKASRTASDARVVGQDVTSAIREAISGRPGPVHLSLPTDVLERDADAHGPAADAMAPRQMPLGRDDADGILAWLRRAQSPLVLMGPSGLSHALRSQMDELGEALGIPVIGMESPRGVQDPSLGTFIEVLAKADAVLLLAKRLDFTLRFGASALFADGCEFVQIDPEPEEIQRAQRALGGRLKRAVVADTRSAAEALKVAGAGRSNGRAWRQDVEAAIRYRPESWDTVRSSQVGRLHPVQVCRPFQSILDRHPAAVLVCDGGEFGQWAQACLRASNRVVNGPAGAIGASLPMAVAARLAKPNAPVIAFLGDGSFGFHAAEFDTAVRYQLPFLAVVGNDAHWNAEFQIQLRTYGPDRAVGCDLLPTRYDQVTTAFGGYGEMVDHPDQLSAAIGRCLECGRPACLNVAIEGVPAPVIEHRPG
ncbi:MAG: thiamine pyrophosphate-binding protein [Casimicrobiaceae bacterium]